MKKLSVKRCLRLFGASFSMGVGALIAGKYYVIVYEKITGESFDK
jgi:hypothetical protein